MIEEHKRWREHEKEQRELVRQHMLAAQQLKRLQVCATPPTAIRPERPQRVRASQREATHSRR
jgi:hypothetical protein